MKRSSRRMRSPLRRLHRERIIHRFTDLRAEFAQPSPRIASVHDATQEAELLGRVGPILTDVILRSSGVRADPLIEVRRPAENVSCMSLLWDFDHNGALQFEYVFVPKEEHLAGALRELVVIERIVVRLPRCLRDVEIRRDAE